MLCMINYKSVLFFQMTFIMISNFSQVYQLSPLIWYYIINLIVLTHWDFIGFPWPLAWTMPPSTIDPRKYWLVWFYIFGCFPLKDDSSAREEHDPLQFCGSSNTCACIPLSSAIWTFLFTFWIFYFLCCSYKHLNIQHVQTGEWSTIRGYPSATATDERNDVTI